MSARPEVLVVRGGTVVDERGTRRADVAVEAGRVVAVDDGLDVPPGATVLDAEACLVSPGLVDIHCHLRQPGAEESECVDSAARAAPISLARRRETVPSR